MNTIISSVFVKVETLVGKSNKISKVANILLDKVAPKDIAVAAPLRGCAGVVSYVCSGKAVCGPWMVDRIKKTRQCCTTNGVTTCGPWTSQVVGCCG